MGTKQSHQKRCVTARFKRKTLQYELSSQSCFFERKKNNAKRIEIKKYTILFSDTFSLQPLCALWLDTFQHIWKIPTAEFAFKAERNSRSCASIQLHPWGHHVASLLVQYSIYKSYVHASVPLLSFLSKNKVASVFSTSKIWQHIQNVRVSWCFQQTKSPLTKKKEEEEEKKLTPLSETWLEL